MGVSFSLGGSTSKTKRFLTSVQSQNLYSDLDSLARRGVAALSQATPVDSGVSAHSWDYVIEKSNSAITITWTNNHTADGTPIVIMLQYGHGTGTGGYVAGRDFINPAMKKVFDEIANEVWKRVTNA